MIFTIINPLKKGGFYYVETIKWRKICCMPLNKAFAPSGSKPQGKITMTIDEYETIRLMDLENCTQETCAMAMNVARTTVQKSTKKHVIN